jgi:phosphohistidine phosphatase
MERLVSRLTTGSAEHTVFKFQNGGIVCLDRAVEGRWYIKWALMPKIG